MGFPLRDIYIWRGEISESAPKQITPENGLCKSELNWPEDDVRIIKSSDDEVKQWKDNNFYLSPMSKYIKDEIKCITDLANSVTNSQEQQIKWNLSKMYSMGGKGYLNVWEIKKNKLHLAKILGGYKLVSSTPIFCDWYSGEIYIGMGKVLGSEDPMGYIPIYEVDIRLKIRSGVVIKRSIIDKRNSPSDLILDGNGFGRRKRSDTLRNFLDIE